MATGGAAANNRGKVFERIVTNELRKAGFVEALRVGMFGGKADVQVDGLQIQTKYYAPARFPGWISEILEEVDFLVVGEAAGSGKPSRRVVALPWPLFIELLRYRRSARENP